MFVPWPSRGSSSRRWRLILCTTCGSHGTHRDCSSLRSNCKKWECKECAPSAEATGGSGGMVWSKNRGQAQRTCGAWESRREYYQVGLLVSTLVWEGKQLGRGLRTCAWERDRGASFSLPPFFHHRLHTWKLRWHALLQQHLPVQGTFLQRHQPGRESRPFLDWLARTYLIRKARVLWSQEGGPLLEIQGRQNH